MQFKQMNVLQIIVVYKQQDKLGQGYTSGNIVPASMIN